MRGLIRNISFVQFCQHPIDEVPSGFFENINRLLLPAIRNVEKGDTQPTPNISDLIALLRMASDAPLVTTPLDVVVERNEHYLMGLSDVLNA